ncbi:hypothetical protein FSP39_004950 [Pinctada imbricata]|uniref:CARD domain-containing protein n=1 Tax=Pinctada imbricata TaxID=66713 RepID=A0AA89C242_PINIB|nr:hypothetical protein FSP39_004950 [Pinctada imbricata]
MSRLLVQSYKKRVIIRTGICDCKIEKNETLKVSWKANIRTSYEQLLKKIDVDKVIMHLHNAKMLTDEMKENIEGENGRYAKGRKLLDIITHRGSHAFTALGISLIKAGNFSLAKELQQDLMSLTSKTKDESECGESLIIDLDNNTEKTDKKEDKRSKIGKNEHRCMINVGDNVFVVANTYKDEMNIHIRQFDENKDGKLFPTKKRSEQTWYLGGGVYASITPEYPTVNIRHFWQPDDATEPMPTKRGMILNNFRFGKLQKAMGEIKDCVPEMNDVTPCMYSYDHMNQEGMLRCRQCNPFEYEMYC